MRKIGGFIGAIATGVGKAVAGKVLGNVAGNVISNLVGRRGGISNLPHTDPGYRPYNPWFHRARPRHIHSGRFR